MTAEDAQKLRICNEVLLAYQNIIITKEGIVMTMQRIFKRNKDTHREILSDTAIEFLEN